ncbi:HNH endonuclease signature motif containing protein [Okibacterium endophyticum]
MVLDSGVLSGSRVDELGYRSFIAELAAAMRVSESSVRVLVEEARVLQESLPLTRAALAAGEIGYRHARVIVDQVWSLPDDAVPGFEERVLPVAKTMTSARFGTAARVLRERLHPETIRERRVKAERGRGVEFCPAADGMAWFGLKHTAEIVSSLHAATMAAARSLHEGAGGVDGRTIQQIAADVLADVIVAGHVLGGTGGPLTEQAPAPATGEPAETVPAEPAPTVPADSLPAEPVLSASAAGADDGGEGAGEGLAGFRAVLGVGDRRLSIRPTVMVTVPVLTLLDLDDEPAILDGYGPIDPETAKRLAGNASSFTRILTHPETGAVLSVGRDSYTVPADLKRALRVRDQTCRFPGCNRKAVNSDIDHTVDWQHGGQTALTNLAHLCRKHHTVKHRTRWDVTQHADGVLEWSTPHGDTHFTYPAHRLPTPAPARPPSRARELLDALLPPPRELPTEPPF